MPIDLSKEQILAALNEQTQALREILAHLKQPKLGFTEAPTLYPIYANRSNGGLWYTMQDGEPLLLPHAAITGYITALKFEKVERRGKESTKLQLFLQGDRPYRLESGHDSHFSKGLLCAIATTPRSQLQAHPITIMPQAGDDESVLFARVFIAGSPIIAPYNDETDWRRVAQMAKEAVATPQAESVKSPTVLRLEPIKALTGHTWPQITGLTTRLFPDRDLKAIPLEPWEADQLRNDLLVDRAIGKGLTKDEAGGVLGRTLAEFDNESDELICSEFLRVVEQRLEAVQPAIEAIPV